MSLENKFFISLQKKKQSSFPSQLKIILSSYHTYEEEETKVQDLENLERIADLAKSTTKHNRDFAAAYLDGNLLIDKRSSQTLNSYAQNPFSNFRIASRDPDIKRLKDRLRKSIKNDNRRSSSQSINRKAKSTDSLTPSSRVNTIDELKAEVTRTKRNHKRTTERNINQILKSARRAFDNAKVYYQKIQGPIQFFVEVGVDEDIEFEMAE